MQDVQLRPPNGMRRRIAGWTVSNHSSLALTHSIDRIAALSVLSHECTLLKGTGILERYNLHESLFWYIKLHVVEGVIQLWDK
jgi:hypothetical protein